MTYAIQIQFADYTQLAKGMYGNQVLPEAYKLAADRKDAQWFIDRAASTALGMGKRAKSGAFYRLMDAEKVKRNLEFYNAIGMGIAIAKGNTPMTSVITIMEV